MSQLTTVDVLKWNALFAPFPSLARPREPREPRTLGALRRRISACAERRLAAGLIPADADPSILRTYQREADRHDRLLTHLLRLLQTPKP